MKNRVVRDFWNEAACGEAAYAVGIDASKRFSSQRETRYELEPFIRPFARFEQGHQQAVLEIGVGMGADHEQWARSGPARLCGIDLTPRAVDLTRERLALAHLESELPGRRRRNGFLFRMRRLISSTAGAFCTTAPIQRRRSRKLHGC